MGPLLPSNYIPALSTVPFYLALTSIITLCIIFSSCGAPQSKSLEEQAQSIDKQLICPFCPAETIDQAQVPQAKEMQAFVREKLAQGWTKQEILDYFSAPQRYGPRVLAEPPKSGPTLAIWILPPAGFLLGGTLVFFIIRAMMKRPPTPSNEPPSVESDMAPYLARIDAEIGARNQPTRKRPGPESPGDKVGPKTPNGDTPNG